MCYLEHSPVQISPQWPQRARHAARCADGCAGAADDHGWESHGLDQTIAASLRKESILFYPSRPPIRKIQKLTRKPHLHQAWIALLPLTLARLTGVLAKTYCLASVDASVYQIARGLLLPFTLLLSLAVLRPRPYFPPLSLVGCGLIMAGFVVGMGSDYSKMLTSGNGILLGIGSSLTTAAESVVVKKLLSTSKEGMWQMIWMSNTMAILFYVPLLPLSGELGATRDIATQKASGGANQFFSGAVLTGLSSFLLTIATFMQIEVTSPTTHMVITAVRGIAQSSLAIIILGEVFNSGRAGSIILILAGSALYGWARDRYAQSGKAAAAAAVEYVPLPDQERGQSGGIEEWEERPKAEV